MQHALVHLCNDKILKKIVDEFGPPIMQIRKQGFASLCHIILEQQVSIASAKACYDKISRLPGGVTATVLDAVSDEELRACGVSRQKTRYLKDLAAKVLRNELDFTSFAQKEEAQIRTELLAIKGVGNWTVEVYLMFCLQAEDIIPFGDIAIRNTIKELYNCATEAEMAILAEEWRPFRTMASYLLWHHYLSKRNRV